MCWLPEAQKELQYLKMGDNKGAIAVFNRDLQINPANGWALTGLRQAYASLKDRSALQRVDASLAAAWQIRDQEVRRAVY